ncbi:hypothetical protein ACWCV2_15370 [Streptomyces pseudogriseolus]
MSTLDPQARAVVRAVDALTAQARRIADAAETLALNTSPATQTDPATADREPCTQHPNAPVIGGVCGGCTQYPTDFPAPADEDGSAPYLLRVLVDRAARGVLSQPGEGEALRRRTEQMIAGRATWKAKAEEIEQDRDDWRRRAEQADAVTAETKRLLERRTTTLRERAERAEAALARARAARDRIARADPREVDAAWCLDLLEAALKPTEPAACCGKPEGAVCVHDVTTTER